MSAFTDALADLDDFTTQEYGIEVELNGHKIQGIVTPIEILQPFGPGGYTQAPTAEISVSREDFAARRSPDPDATQSRNIFKVNGERLRVMGTTDDPSCTWIRFQCGPVDK